MKCNQQEVLTHYSLVLIFSMSGKATFTNIVIATGLLSILSVGMFGAFGALVHYLYTIVKTEGNYSLKMMIWFMIFGFFVALMTHFLMVDFFGRSYEGVLLLSGFLVLRILDFLDESGLIFRS